MRHAGQLDVRDLAPDDQVDDLAVFGIACGANEIGIVLIKKEIIQVIIQFNPAYPELALDRDALTHFVIVHIAGIDRIGVLVIGNFPHLRDILERNNKTLAWRRGIDSTDARTVPTIVLDRNDLHQRQVACVQQHQGMRQIIPHQHEATVV